MCGIAGIVSAGAARIDGARAAAAVRRMTERLRHRGPDDSGFHDAPPVWFGMRRLSVIDLETGAQPVRNESGSVTAVYNGEIYNFRELRERLESRGHRFATRCDSEVIVHLWEEHGLGAFDRLNGMFAVALHDADRGEVVLARDRLGIKPLFGYHDDAGLRFASEPGALFADPDVPRQPDLDAIADYLTHWYAPSPATGFAGVFKLNPGEVLVVSAGGAVSRSRWGAASPTQPTAAVATLDEAAELVEPALQDAVERQLVADVPVGVFLSGGLDSALVATLAARSARKRLEAFTIGFPDHRSFDEAPVAAAIARAAGLRHVVLQLPDDAEMLVTRTLDTFDEPFGDFSAVPMGFLCREARRRVTVVLSGDGGDEIFAGYPHYRAPRFASIFRRLPRTVRRWIAGAVLRLPSSYERVSLDYMAKRFVRGAEATPLEAHLLYKAVFFDAEKRALLGPLLRDRIDRDPMAGLRPQLEAAAACDGPLVRRLMELDRRTFLLDDNLVKVDRTSMAASLEVRVPLLDREAIEAADAVPPALHLAGRKTKAVLRRVAERLLPGEVAGLSKRGFTPPMSHWMQGPLTGLLDRHLGPSVLERVGLVRAAPVAELLGLHRAGKRECSRELWTLLSLHHWWAKQGF